MNKVKEHLKENWKLYLGVSLGIGISVGVYVILNSGKIDGALIKINQIGFRTEANPTIINLVERSTPSKPVHLVGTNLYFDSLNEAARQTGHSLSRISQNVNGIIPDINGDVFELLQAA